MIDIYYFGKLKNKNIKKSINYYKKLSDNKLNININKIKEEKSNNLKKRKSKEMKRLKNRIQKDNNYTFILDEKGKNYTSNMLIKKINGKLKRGKGVSFYIGNFYGIDTDILKMGDKILALSNLTFNHEIVLLILMEQIFRLKNEMFGGSYQK